MFVEKDVDEETQAFYGKKKFLAVLGSDYFRASIHSGLPANVELPEIRKLTSGPSFLSIVQAVSAALATFKTGILQAAQGRGKKDIARSTVINC